MRETDLLGLDGRILRTFLTILEENSVSRAADRLGVTQSAVSHALAKLREVLGDPLFVRSGQGLTPTETALSLKRPVQDILDRLKSLSDQRAFDPRGEAMHFVIAANDMQRDLILPDLARAAWDDGVDLSFEVKPSGIPSVSLLRDARCDLILTPLPPDAPDMIQQKLFSGRMMCFFDGAERDPPATTDAYLAADHVAVRFVLGGGSNDVLRAPSLPHMPKPRVTVSNFAGIPKFLRGTRMITTQFELMKIASLSALDTAPLPFPSERISIFMVWHERSKNDPAHGWLRARVRDVSARFV